MILVIFKGQGPGLVNVLWVEAYRNNAIPDDLLSDVGDPTQTLPIASLSLGASVKAAEPVVPRLRSCTTGTASLLRPLDGTRLVTSVDGELWLKVRGLGGAREQQGSSSSPASTP